MSSSAQVAQTPVASAENAQRPVGAQPPRDEDEVEQVVVTTLEAIAEALFTDDPNSSYTLRSLKEVALAAKLLVKKVGNGHQLDVEKTVERWVQEYTNSSHASPLEITVLKILLTSLLQGVKVHTKLTQYGNRFLLVLTGGENLCENVSDVVNLVDLYFRGEHVFFGLSLGCVVIEILSSSAFVYLTGQDPRDYIYTLTTSYPCIWLYRYVNDIGPPEGCTMRTEQIMFSLMSFKSNIVSFLQALVCLVFLLTSEGSLSENSIQVASLCLSVLMMAVSQVGLAYEYELKVVRDHPQLAKKGHHFGIFPNFQEKPWQCAFCLLGLFFLILGCCIGTLFAFTATAIAFGVWVPFVIVGSEGAANVIAQACRGQLFRANLVGDHSFAVRTVDATLFHFFVTYPAMAIAPTIQYRHPEVVGGAYFTMGCVYARVRDFVLLGESGVWEV